VGATSTYDYQPESHMAAVVRPATHQHLNERVFSLVVSSATPPEATPVQTLRTGAGLNKLVMRFIEVAKADHLEQTGSDVDLPRTECLITYDDAEKVTVFTATVVMDAWPENLTFGPSVWDFLDSNVDVVD
jgi:hypothetical protein